jgi:hypothetical protein
MKIKLREMPKLLIKLGAKKIKLEDKKVPTIPAAKKRFTA